MIKEITLSGPQQYILQSVSDYNLFMAGIGSGKTHTMAYGSAELITEFPDVIGFLGANTYDQLNKSTLRQIFKVWKNDLNWIPDQDYVVDKRPLPHFREQAVQLKSYTNTISFSNGALIFINSLDNYRAIDGQEFGWAMLDETKDTDPEAINEVIVWRLRQKGIYVDSSGALTRKPTGKGFNPLYIFTSPAKEQWLNEMFGLDKRVEEIEKHIYSKTDFFRFTDEQNTVVISSTWHNEHNLPAGFIERLMTKYQGNQNLINTFIYGSPVAKVGGEFYSTFERSKHCQKITEYPSRIFHVGSDQNVNPYFTLLNVQIHYNEQEDRYKVYFRKEYCPENPHNNMEYACKLWKIDHADLCDSIYYYGDVSGKVQQTMRDTTEHHYDVLEDVLREFIHTNSNRLLNQNPSVIRRRDFIRALFAGVYNIDIIIDPEGCPNLVADLEYLKEDKDGNKLKKIVKDKSSGKSYQKYGHTSDTMDYILCSAFSEYFEEFNKR